MTQDELERELRERVNAAVQAEREAVLKVCALDGVTLADIIRIVQERSRA